MADLRQKIQNGLDETRILVLGAQVLLGFELRSVFEKSFDKLPVATQDLKLASLGLMLVALGLLMWPTPYHRIVAEGEDTWEFHAFITRAAAPALLPFALAIGIDLFVAGERLFGSAPGIVMGAAAALTALWFWYGLEWWAQRGDRHRADSGREGGAMDGGERESADAKTSTSERVRQVLTEARVVLPGAQALLGFQLATTLMEGFDRLAFGARVTHLCALALVALATILLMTPAAYHRIVEQGDDTEHFHRFTSRALLTAMAILAAGISLDFYVVVLKATGAPVASVAAGCLAIAFFYGLWFGVTLYARHRRRVASPRAAHAPARAEQG